MTYCFFPSPKATGPSTLELTWLKLSHNKHFLFLGCYLGYFVTYFVGRAAHWSLLTWIFVLTFYTVKGDYTN